MNAIYKLTGQLPIKAHLDKGILSIIYNIWSNGENPVNKLMSLCANDAYNKGTWLEEAECVLKHYDLLNLKSLLVLKCPEKTSWKNFCLKEI